MEMIRKAAAVEVLAATTSDYLHATPNTSSGLKLDEGIFR
jgi:hypothetical protein